MIAILVFSLVILFLASYFDIKSREVPDTLSYILIIGGLILQAINAAFFSSFSQIIFMPIATGVLFGFSYAMYRAGQWGGGDVKLMLGLSTVFTSLSISNNSSFISLFINVLIFGGLYGLFGTIALGVIRFKKLIKFLHLYDAAILVSGAVIMYYLLTYLPEPINFLAAFAGVIFLSMRYIYIIAENLMFMNVPVSKLTEGDWLASDVLDSKGDKIIGRRNIGLVEEDIQKLKKAGLKEVLVKTGLPFVPGIFLGALITVILGNPLLSMLLSSFSAQV